MASLSRDKNGTKRVLFIDAQRKRHTIRLGKVSVKAAEAFKLRLEHLISAHRTGTAPDAQTSEWIATLPDEIHDRLERAGLVEPRIQEASHTLGDLLEACFGSMNVKDSTRTRYKQSERLLFEYFGQDQPLDSITTRQADEYRSWLQRKGYASAKISRDISIAKMFMRRGLRWGMLTQDPFEGVVAGSQSNPARLAFLSQEDAHKLINASPNADWRCIIALARFGGLRCPSEVLAVRWSDVDWASLKLRVRSPKTERYEGKSERIIPLFPELHRVLLEAFELAEPGAEHVVAGYRDPTVNLRTQLLRIIDRAGLKPWPRQFNTMRASRATELASEYPAAVCNAWMGHTQAIAQKHYHMVREEDFARATGSTNQSGAESGALGAQNPSQQQAARPGTDTPNPPKKQQGPDNSPAPSSPRTPVQDRFNGRNRTRTCDLCHVTAAL